MKDFDKALLKDPHLHLLKSEEFTAARLGPRFQAWGVLVPVKLGPLTDDFVEAAYLMRCPTPDIANFMAEKMWKLWEHYGFNRLCKKKWKRRDWIQDGGWPDAVGRFEAEMMTDGEFTQCWREAQDRCFRLGEWSPNNRKGVRIWHASGRGGVHVAPDPWQHEKNPMAFTYYVGKPIAAPPEELREKQIRLIVPPGFTGA